MSYEPAIPFARPSAVTDRQLEGLVKIADQIERSTATEEGVLMFMSCVAPCLRELQQRRSAARMGSTIAAADNVTYLTESGH